MRPDRRESAEHLLEVILTDVVKAAAPSRLSETDSKNGIDQTPSIAGQIKCRTAGDGTKVAEKKAFSGTRREQSGA